MAEQTRLTKCTTKPRVFVISDISNEPDDAESLVRFLLYGNELDIQGLVACTSCWMRNEVHPEDMHKIINAYASVVDNLNSHVHPDNQYPSADYLRSIIKSGPALYGMEALKAGVALSEGAKLLVDQVDASDDPLWVLFWGGTNVLAQALQHIQISRPESEMAKFCSKLRVYAISDQDNTSHWVRTKFPQILYISSIHAWKEYPSATWIGISGDIMAPLDGGAPDGTKITKAWLRENIQIGPYGSVYPDYSFIMEGDTPTFLFLIQNGLGSRDHPHWGSWGGRYGRVSLDANQYADVKDEVIGVDDKKAFSNHATIWRWRDAFQDDFAARMRWTLSNDRSKANHAPVVIVNGSPPGPEYLYLEAEAGSTITLDASETYDPDGDELSFSWFQYKEPTRTQSEIHWPLVADVEFTPTNGNADKPKGAVVDVQLPPAESCAVNILTGEALKKGQILHLILEVKDNAALTMRAYKRVVLQVTNMAGKGASGKVYKTVTEALGHSTG